MNSFRKNRGITLVQVIIAVALTVIVMRAGMQLFSMLSQGTNKNLAISQAEQELRRTGLFLKTRLGGTRNFQNVSFKVPDITVGAGIPGGATIGPGFLVTPNRDCQGNTYLTTDPNASDVLFAMIKLPTKVQLKLSSNLAQNDSTLVLKQLGSPINWGTIIEPASVSTLSDLLAVTTTNITDVFHFTEDATALNNSNATLTLNFNYTNTFSNTGGAATKLYNEYGYLADDYVDRAQIIMACLDKASNEIRVGPFTTAGGLSAGYQVIGRNMTRFQIAYNLNDADRGCSTVTTAANEYKRDEWTTLAGTPYTCYMRLLSMQVTFDTQPTISMRNIANEALTEEMKNRGINTGIEYIFISNFVPPN